MPRPSTTQKSSASSEARPSRQRKHDARPDSRFTLDFVHGRVRLLRGGGVTHDAEIRAMCGTWGLLRLQTAAPWVFVC
ncbi:hypothetical protein F383_32777 [Gossypium arboreum]|uniref:Uncharacterized protein n=1 Tax=Gossypium arboreum TaxID=29729 RepID=A0A0B0PMN2_GOSAR|nr:hypothetical protein F383_32777 [Gossypium arboreum]